MSSLSTCVRCDGFVPSTSSCPHCGAEQQAPRGFTGLWVAAGAAVSALTLMACYGAPPCDHNADAGEDSSSCYDQYPEDAGGDAGTDAGQ